MSFSSIAYNFISLIRILLIGTATLLCIYLLDGPPELPAAEDRSRKDDVLGFESQKIRNLELKLGLLREKYNYLQRETEYYLSSDYENEKIDQLERMIEDLELKNRKIQRKILERLQRSAGAASVLEVNPKKKKKKRFYKFYVKDGQVFVGRILKQDTKSITVYNPATKTKFKVLRAAVIDIAPSNKYTP